MPAPLLPNHGAQRLPHPLPNSTDPPFPEMPPDRAPGWQVVRHHCPRYSTTQHVQYAVYHPPQICSSGMSPACIQEQQSFQQAPLVIGQIGGIRSPFHTPKLTKAHRAHQATSRQVYSGVAHPFGDRYLEDITGVPPSGSGLRRNRADSKEHLVPRERPGSRIDMRRQTQSTIRTPRGRLWRCSTH